MSETKKPSVEEMWEREGYLAAYDAASAARDAYDVALDAESILQALSTDARVNARRRIEEEE
jgi:hypothetical protein